MINQLKNRMVKVKITRAVGVHGKGRHPGEVVEVDDATANLLVGMGKAERAKEDDRSQDSEPVKSDSDYYGSQMNSPKKRRVS